jgi:aspergillopepsin I
MVRLVEVSSAFVLLASVAGALPTQQAKTFTVKQVPNPAANGKNGTAALLKAYRKFNGKLPQQLAALAAQGSVAANPQQDDSEYLCPVSIGGQTLNLDFDTGSADL